jgi:hypothetical protein
MYSFYPFVAKIAYKSDKADHSIFTTNNPVARFVFMLGGLTTKYRVAGNSRTIKGVVHDQAPLVSSQGAVILMRVQQLPLFVRLV